MNGLRTVWREERNFRIEILAAVVVLISAFVVPFSWIERGLLLAAITIVLTAEIVNTTVEDLCDKVEPEHDAVIGKIKDIMAAYVLVSVCGAIALGVCALLSHFMR